MEPPAPSQPLAVPEETKQSAPRVAFKTDVVSRRLRVLFTSFELLQYGKVRLMDGALFWQRVAPPMQKIIDRADRVVKDFKELIESKHRLGQDEVDAIETDVYHIMLAEIIKKRREGLNIGLVIDRQSIYDAYVFFGPSFSADSLLAERDETWYPFHLFPEFKEPRTQDELGKIEHAFILLRNNDKVVDFGIELYK